MDIRGFSSTFCLQFVLYSIKADSHCKLLFYNPSVRGFVAEFITISINLVFISYSKNK